MFINRFQIQMQAVGQSQEQVGTRPFLHELKWEEESGEASSALIRDLLDRGKEVFVVEECRSRGGNQHLQQELIKQKILSYNRKEKSLEELSRKFIDNFEGRGEVSLELDKVTTVLCVERRRIYDIVNIFQSLQVVRKAAKNHYIWRGLQHAVATISSVFDSQSITHSNKKEKSLENLAARFLRLFVSTDDPMSLEEAARVLIQTDNSALVKTKIRRLYDIVNVFKSVGLVEKTPMPNKKPGFRWLGTERLVGIIEQQRKKWRESPQEGEKENEKALENSGNVNDWFSQDEHKVFASLGLMKQFSQKVFFPSIIQKESSLTTMLGSQDCLTDLCPQY